jgi:hypothetical protein
MVGEETVAHRLNLRRTSSSFRRGSAISTAPPELVELFVDVRHPLALTAMSTATRTKAIRVCFSPTCFSRPDEYK